MKNASFHRGSTALGIIVGVILGLAVALSVSLYLANSGAPIQARVENSANRIEPPKDITKALDPNEGLYGKPKPTVVPDSNSEDSADVKLVKDNKEAKEKDINDTKELKALKPSFIAGAGVDTTKTVKQSPAQDGSNKPEQDDIGKIAALHTPAHDTGVATATPAASSKTAETVVMPKVVNLSTANSTTNDRYFVQVGAYSSITDAENVKNKISAQGVVMGVSSREKDGQILHRVRTPALQAAEAERLRNTLKANGVEAALVKVQ